MTQSNHQSSKKSACERQRLELLEADGEELRVSRWKEKEKRMKAKLAKPRVTWFWKNPVTPPRTSCSQKYATKTSQAHTVVNESCNSEIFQHVILKNIFQDVSCEQ